MHDLARASRRYVQDADIADSYDRYFADNPLFELDSQLLAGWISRPGRLLDVGCGTGRHMVQFARRGFWVVGLDLSPHMLRQASRKLGRLGLGQQLIRADMVQLEKLFQPSRFDYVICMFSTLGLIAGAENRRRFFHGVQGVLRPGGLFAVHVHNRRHNLLRADGLAFLVGNAVRWALDRAEWGDKLIRNYRGISKMCIHVFSLKEVERLLRAAGLQVQEVVFLNRRRSGRLRGRLAASWRANGFILLARKPAATG